MPSPQHHQAGGHHRQEASVVPATVATSRHPSAAMAVSDLLSPSAEIAIKSPQVDASISGSLIHASIPATAGNGAAMLLSTPHTCPWPNLLSHGYTPRCRPALWCQRLATMALPIQPTGTAPGGSRKAVRSATLRISRKNRSFIRPCCCEKLAIPCQRSRFFPSAAPPRRLGDQRGSS
jgi:hypothetical protein